MRSHNTFTQFSSEGGLPALILYLLILWHGFTNTRKTKRLAYQAYRVETPGRGPTRQLDRIHCRLRVRECGLPVFSLYLSCVYNRTLLDREEHSFAFQRVQIGEPINYLRVKNMHIRQNRTFPGI